MHVTFMHAKRFSATFFWRCYGWPGRYVLGSMPGDADPAGEPAEEASASDTAAWSLAINCIFSCQEIWGAHSTLQISQENKHVPGSGYPKHPHMRPRCFGATSLDPCLGFLLTYPPRPGILRLKKQKGTCKQDMHVWLWCHVWVKPCMSASLLCLLAGQKKIRKKSAKNPQKKRKKTANGRFFKKCLGSEKKTENSEMHNQNKHFFKLRPFAVFCVRFAVFLRPFAVSNFQESLRSGHCSSKLLQLHI